MWSDWQQLTIYLKRTFSIKGDLLSVLFLIGVQESGSGFKTYTQQEKTDLIKLAKYTLLTEAGFYQKINIVSRNPVFFSVDNHPLPRDSFALTKILKNQIIFYFNKINLPYYGSIIKH